MIMHNKVMPVSTHLPYPMIYIYIAELVKKECLKVTYSKKINKSI